MKRAPLRFGPALVASLLALFSLSATAETLGNFLAPGPHVVGFRTITARDASRPTLVVPSEPSDPTAGRLVPLHVWYPAAVSEGPVLTLADYADALAYSADLDALDASSRSAARSRFIASIAELGGDRAIAEHEQSRLLAAGGRAQRNAAPASGPFPVLLFPEYYAPASNSVLAEHLASHGYVVVSVPMLAWRSVNWTGGTPPNFESYVSDLQFALGVLRDLPFADRSRIAAIGVGISANAVAALQMRNPLVRLHVSLDGGLISPTEDATLKRTPYFDATALRSPMLFLWSPHPNLVPALMDQYKYADRLALHLPGMSEYRYLNYGPLEVLAPGLLGQPPGDTVAGYTWAARYVRAFLDAHLLGDAAARGFLAAEPEKNGVPAASVRRRALPALPAPPSIEEVQSMILARGVGEFIALHRRLRERDPEPYGMAALLQLSVWASAPGRDPDASIRKALGELRVEIFPASSRAHYALAVATAARSEHALARRHFDAALSLLDADKDPSSDDAMRHLLRQRIEDALKRLPPL